MFGDAMRDILEPRLRLAGLRGGIRRNGLRETHE